jgi:hypothetical protein
MCGTRWVFGFLFIMCTIAPAPSWWRRWGCSSSSESPPPQLRCLELRAPPQLQPKKKAPGARGQFRHRNSATAYAGSGASRPYTQKKPLNRRWSPPVGGSPIIGRRVGLVDIRSLSGQHFRNAILVHIRSQMISRAEPAVAAFLTLAEAAKPHVTAVILYIHVTLRGALRVLVGVAPVLGRIRCMGRRA